MFPDHSNLAIMSKDLDASTKTLGTLFCFVLIAYISYYLGRCSLTVQPNIHPTALCDRPCCRQADTPAEEKLNRIEDERQKALIAGRQVEIERILAETEKVEMRIKIDIARWHDERKLEMKKWREEQIRWLWDSKQKGEKGILGWFGAGRRN
jgi:hypothetical protein